MLIAFGKPVEESERQRASFDGAFWCAVDDAPTQTV
jgi:hypothetical protein